MLVTDFNKNTDFIISKVRNILITKQAEYAETGASGDRLMNFKYATTMLNTNQARVCLMYATKHFASIAKITEDIDKGIFPTDEIIEEKIQDATAYCILLYSCLMELKKSRTDTCPISLVTSPENDVFLASDTCTLSKINTPKNGQTSQQ